MIVVVAVDGSEQTHKIKRSTFDYASGAELHFVHVAESYIYPSMISDGVVIDLAAIRASQRAAVWDVVGSLPPSAVKVDLEGPVAGTIVGYAREVVADLIVIGSRGRGALGSLVLGSVSLGVIHSAECNVLVVK